MLNLKTLVNKHVSYTRQNRTEQQQMDCVNSRWFLESQLSQFESETRVNFVFYSTLLSTAFLN